MPIRHFLIWFIDSLEEPFRVLFFDAKMECEAFVLDATHMRNGRKKRVRKGKRCAMVLNKKRRSEK